MASECYVLDDWLIHDLTGDNGPDYQEEADRFLKMLKKKCDRIAFLVGTSWAKKTHALMTYSDSRRRKISKHLHNVILLDLRKCQKLYPTQIEPIPEHLRAIIAEADEDDMYLFETYYAANADALVTTDGKLFDKLSKTRKLNVNMRLRDEFLQDYFSEA